MIAQTRSLESGQRSSFSPARTVERTCCRLKSDQRRKSGERHEFFRRPGATPGQIGAPAPARARIQSGRDRCRVCHYLDGLISPENLQSTARRLSAIETRGGSDHLKLESVDPSRRCRGAAPPLNFSLETIRIPCSVAPAME